MKPTAHKTRKQYRPAVTTKPRCGTLNYMAECRGMQKMTGHLQSRVASINRIRRKRPAL